MDLLIEKDEPLAISLTALENAKFRIIMAAAELGITGDNISLRNMLNRITEEAIQNLIESGVDVDYCKKRDQ